MAAKVTSNAFMHGFGSVISMFPHKQRKSLRFIYRGRDIRYTTGEQTLRDSWQSVGNALNLAIRTLPGIAEENADE